MQTESLFRRGMCGLVLFLGWGVASSAGAIVAGDVTEVAANVTHPNGNVYDQLLMTGATAAVSADAGQVMRISFVDLDDDIIQVEFSGSGVLTLTLESATGPALATKYNQPGVLYMRGHARIQISGSNASSNVSVFSVGPGNAVNQSIIKAGEVYDSIADVAEIEIVADSENPNGSGFGGIRAANANFWAHAGRAGIYAPRVHVQNVVRIGDMQAFDDASPALVFGRNSQFVELSVAEGGTLVQPNERLIAVDYQFSILFLGYDGPIYFGPIPPGGPWSARYFTGPDGEPLLWVVPHSG